MTKDTLPTTEALKQLLDQPDLWRRTGRSMRQRTNYKSILNTGQRFPLKLRMQLLTEAGYTLKKEAIWQLPEVNSEKKFEIVRYKNCKKQA